MPRLTRTLIEKTPKSAKEVWLRDTELRGFSARVLPSGGVAFYLATKKEGRTSKVSIGDYELLSVEEAREKARDVKKALREGADLKVALGASQACEKTVRDLAETHQKVHQVKASTGATYKIYWDAHIVKRLGDVRVKDLTRLRVEEFRVELRSKTSANRSIKLLSKAINDMNGWGEGWPTIPNPRLGISKFKEKKRELILKKAESRKLWDELEKRVTEDPENRTAWLLMILMMTGLRTGEWRDTPWAWVDMKAGELKLPDTKANVPRTVDLEQPVIDLLRRMPRRGKWIFPNATGKRPIGKPKTQWVSIKKAAKISPKFRVHDIRHTFASIALAGGCSIKEVGELLGHSQISTTGRYLHLLEGGRKNAAKKATDAIVRSVS